MKANELCKDCCMKKARGLLEQQGVEGQELRQAMTEIEQLTAQTGAEESAPYLMSRAMEVVERLTEIEDAYAEPKRKYNELLLAREEELYKEAKTAEDSVLAGLQYALTGNYIDFGAMDDVKEEKLNELLQAREQREVDLETYQQLCMELEDAKSLAYITDNAGEIVLDKVFLRILKERYPKLKIDVIVRGAPALNDATVEDALEIGLDTYVSVMGNGTSIPGTPLEHIGEEPRRIMEEADVCIAKGQGNFETMSGCGLNVYYLFLCKCKLFVDMFGVKQFTGMLKNERHIR